MAAQLCCKPWTIVIYIEDNSLLVYCSKALDSATEGMNQANTVGGLLLAVKIRSLCTVLTLAYNRQEDYFSSFKELSSETTAAIER